MGTILIFVLSVLAISVPALIFWEIYSDFRERRVSFPYFLAVGISTLSSASKREQRNKVVALASRKERPAIRNRSGITQQMSGLSALERLFDEAGLGAGNDRSH